MLSSIIFEEKKEKEKCRKNSGFQMAVIKLVLSNFYNFVLDFTDTMSY